MIYYIYIYTFIAAAVAAVAATDLLLFPLFIIRGEQYIDILL